MTAGMTPPGRADLRLPARVPPEPAPVESGEYANRDYTEFDWSWDDHDVALYERADDTL